MTDSIDVLICAHNDVEHVGRALDSLERQTIGAEYFRVVVVDNASNDGTAELVNSYTARLDLVYVLEQRLGLNTARSTGYSSSQADYIAHLDADTRAHPQWLEHIQRVIAEVQPNLCGGPYYPYYLSPKPAWFLDWYNMNFHGDRARYLDQNEYLSGTNMIWRRSVVQALGGFKPSVGLAGRGLARGDETELIVRARSTLSDFRVYYDPEIIVYHLTRPNTYSMSYWARRYFVQGRRRSNVFGGTPSVMRSLGVRDPRPAVSALARIITGFAQGLLSRDRRRFPFFQNYVYEQVMPEFAVIGELFAD